MTPSASKKVAAADRLDRPGKTRLRTGTDSAAQASQHGVAEVGASMCTTENDITLLVDALIAAKDRGVDVRVMVDHRHGSNIGGSRFPFRA